MKNLAESKSAAVVASEEVNDPQSKKTGSGPPWRTLAVFLVFSIALICLFGLGLDSISLLWVELILAAASVAIGGIVGFLFGLPRTHLRGGDEKDLSSDLVYQPGTNLEQISDWLTKILIGVGLVELRELGAILSSMGAVFSATLTDTASRVAVVSQIVAIVFSILGFIVSYLWTRIYYGPLQTRVDGGLIAEIRSRFENVQKSLSKQSDATSKLETVTQLVASGALISPKGEVPKHGGLPIAETSLFENAPSIPAQIREKIAKFETLPEDWDSDPGADLFPNAPDELNGRKLDAKLVAGFNDYIVIRLDVTRSAGEPFSGDVQFLLHPTFRQPIRKATVKDDVAEISIYAEGWFTAVAILDNGETVLSKSLKDLPGAPDWFRED